MENKLVRIYTDGACSGNPGPGGWSAVLLFDEGRKEISGCDEETTNNRMELTAIIKGLIHAYKLGYEKVRIYSDSAYCVNAVNNNWLRKWKNKKWLTSKDEMVKNKDLWIKLIKILNKIDVEFIKVKGHSDNILNNRSDYLARQEVLKINAKRSV